MDLSEIDELERLLEAAGDDITPAAERAVEFETGVMTAAARANASGRQDTGELLASIDSEVDGLDGKLMAMPRQASLLEHGTPSTGAPWPWASGPGERSQEALLDRLKREAAPW